MASGAEAHSHIGVYDAGDPPFEVLYLTADLTPAGPGSVALSFGGPLGVVVETPLNKAFAEANLNPLVSDWRRKRTCEEYVRRLKQAGLADQIPSHHVLLEEFGAAEADQGGQDSDGRCQGVNGRLAHDHIFYWDGRFASVDNNGRFVDNDRYKLTNDHTIVFPNSRNDSFRPLPPTSDSAMI